MSPRVCLLEFQETVEVPEVESADQERRVPMITKAEFVDPEPERLSAVGGSRQVFSTARDANRCRCSLTVGGSRQVLSSARVSSRCRGSFAVGGGR